MLQIERHEKIVQYINEIQKTTTEQLAEQLNVSKPTIRRDIDTLSKAGLIRKVHGGAVAVSSTSLHEIPYSNKQNTNASAKQKIGIAAARLIESGDIIILDSGTTSLEVAKNLDKPEITVLTNDIKIAMELAVKDNVQTFVCEGRLNTPVYTLSGSAPIEFFKKVHVNKLFLGCDALDFSFGISDSNSETAEAKKAMIHAADEVILITDASKIGKKTFCYVCDISNIHTIITDTLDDIALRIFKENGTDVILTDYLDGI